MNSDTALQQRSMVERIILCVKTISGLGAIPRDENFFKAGLSSIMLTRLKQTVENDFGVAVPVRLFYDRTDTVEKLARYVLENGDGDPGLSSSGAMGPETVHPFPRAGAVADQGECQLPVDGIMAIFNRQLDLMDRQLEEGEAAYHITAAAVIDGRLDVETFKIAFSTLIQRHESLCTGFEIRDDELVQRVHDHCFFEVTDFEMGTDDPERFGNDRAIPELPLDSPRGHYLRFAGKILRHTVDPEKAARLSAFARERGVTLFMLLLSCYAIFQSKPTGTISTLSATWTRSGKTASRRLTTRIIPLTTLWQNWGLKQAHFF